MSTGGILNTGKLTRSQELIQKSRERALENQSQKTPSASSYSSANTTSKENGHKKKKKKGIKKLFSKHKHKKNKGKKDHNATNSVHSLSSLESKSSLASDQASASLTALAAIEDSVGLTDVDRSYPTIPLVEPVEEGEEEEEEMVFDNKEKKDNVLSPGSAVLDLEDTSKGGAEKENENENETSKMGQSNDEAIEKDAGLEDKEAEVKRTKDKETLKDSNQSNNSPTEKPARVFTKRHPTLSRSQELILKSRQRAKQHNPRKANTAPVATVNVLPPQSVSFEDNDSQSVFDSIRCCKKTSKRRDSFEAS